MEKSKASSSKQHHHVLTLCNAKIIGEKSRINCYFAHSHWWLVFDIYTIHIHAHSFYMPSTFDNGIIFTAFIMIYVRCSTYNVHCTSEPLEWFAFNTTHYTNKYIQTHICIYIHVHFHCGLISTVQQQPRQRRQQRNFSYLNIFYMFLYTSILSLLRQWLDQSEYFL